MRDRKGSNQSSVVSYQSPAPNTHKKPLTLNLEPWTLNLEPGTLN